MVSPACAISEPILYNPQAVPSAPATLPAAFKTCLVPSFVTIYFPVSYTAFYPTCYAVPRVSLPPVVAAAYLAKSLVAANEIPDEGIEADICGIDDAMVVGIVIELVNGMLFMFYNIYIGY
jgi:hypothetical protein